jgi:hypothetical protein
MRNITLLTILLSLPFYLQAQKIRFKDISRQEMELSRCEFYPEAKAVVLDRRGEITFTYNASTGLMYNFAEGVRVKILDAAAVDRGNIKLRYYSPKVSLRENNERVMEIRGVTYNLEEGKIVATRLERSDVYRARLNDFMEEVSFALPAVKAGSVIEYTYARESSYISYLPDWFFQEDIPTLSNELLYIIPGYFNFQARMMGEVQHVQREEKKVNVYLGADSHPGISVHMKARDVPPVEEEPFVSNACDLPFRVEFQLVSVDLPGTPVMSIAGNYTRFNKQLAESDNFWPPATRGSFPRELNEKVAGMSTTEKIAYLHAWMQEQVTWNNTYGIFATRRAGELLKERRGSVAEINLALNALFTQHGLEAYPVILSTRGHGVIHPVYPNIEDFNYVISAVVAEGGKAIFCDATTRGPVGLLPPRCLNGNGWLVREEGGMMVPLRTNASLNESVLAAIRFEEGKMVTDISITDREYAAANTRERHDREGEEGLREELREAYPNSTLSRFEITFTPGMVQQSFVLEQATSDAGILYIHPFPARLLSESPFKRDTRATLVDFPCGTVANYTTTLRVPEGYEMEPVEYSEYTLQGKGAAYSFSGYNNEEGYTLVVQVIIRQLLYTPEEYPELKMFFDKLAELSRAVVVLKKKA